MLERPIVIEHHQPPDSFSWSIIELNVCISHKLSSRSHSLYFRMSFWSLMGTISIQCLRAGTILVEVVLRIACRSGKLIG